MNSIDGKIESFLIDEIENVNDIDVLENISISLTYNRFDVAFKLLYIDGLARGKMLDFEEEIYRKHIHAFSLGSFSEPGNGEKNTIIDYENTFSNLYIDIKNKGFDKEKSLIPLAADGSILNGAHRTSIAIYLGSKVSAVRTEIPAYDYGYHFFKKRGVPAKTLDTVALKYIEYANNCFLAIIWPAAVGHEKATEDLMGGIIYKKEIKLNYLGAHNLLSEAYQDEPWLGSAKNNYPGIKHKLTKCFSSFGKIKIYIFQRESLNETLALKESVRKLFNIGKHALHITDTDEETLRISRLLLNENGRHFLNNAQPNKYQNTLDKISLFTNELNNDQLSISDYALTSDMVMAAYGLRKSLGISYLTVAQKIVNKTMGYNEKELSSYTVNEENIVRNQDYHFWFRKVKFVSLPQLYVMKCGSLDEEDVVDSLLIKDLVKNNRLKSFMSIVKYKIIFVQAKAHIKVISLIKKLTKKLNIYPIARKVYRKYKWG